VGSAPKIHTKQNPCVCAIHLLNPRQETACQAWVQHSKKTKQSKTKHTKTNIYVRAIQLLNLRQEAAYQAWVQHSKKQNNQKQIFMFVPFIYSTSDKKLPAKRGFMEKGAVKKGLKYSNHYYTSYAIASIGVLLAGVSPYIHAYGTHAYLLST
jgi:hypothetical protein